VVGILLQKRQYCIYLNYSFRCSGRTNEVMSPIATTNEKISSTVKRETSRLLVDVKHQPTRDPRPDRPYPPFAATALITPLFTVDRQGPRTPTYDTRRHD
jgi:hypothetical protein